MHGAVGSQRARVVVRDHDLRDIVDSMNDCRRLVNAPAGDTPVAGERTARVPAGRNLHCSDDTLHFDRPCSRCRGAITQLHQRIAAPAKDAAVLNRAGMVATCGEHDRKWHERLAGRAGKGRGARRHHRRAGSAMLRLRATAGNKRRGENEKTVHARH
jgi:hypothetical protein